MSFPLKTTTNPGCIAQGKQGPRVRQEYNNTAILPLVVRQGTGYGGFQSRWTTRMSRTRETILESLADGEWHSGARIAETLAVTRASVGQQVARLRAQGWQIEGQAGSGYRLQGPGRPLRRQVIEACPGMAPDLFASAEFFAAIESTSDYLARSALSPDGRGCLCVAEHQTAGRGRRGREWVAPPGASIAFSLARMMPLPPADLTPMALVTAVATTDALTSLGARGLALKWPNDIEADSAKLGGILIDISGETDGPTRIVIGIGLNHDLGAVGGVDLGRTVTDCARVWHGEVPPRDEIICRVATAVARACTEFVANGFPPFRAHWDARDSLAGHAVRLQITPQRWVDGVAAGVDASGALLLDTHQGRQRFFAGDASVRARS